MFHPRDIIVTLQLHFEEWSFPVSVEIETEIFSIIGHEISRRYFFCGYSMFFFCLVFVMPLCASVYFTGGHQRNYREIALRFLRYIRDFSRKWHRHGKAKQR